MSWDLCHVMSCVIRISHCIRVIVHEYHMKLHAFHMNCTYAVWSKWQLPPDGGRTAVQDSLLRPTPLRPQDASSFTHSDEQENIAMGADESTNVDDTPPSPRVTSDSSLGVPLPPPPQSLPSTSDNFIPSHRPYSHTVGTAKLRRDSTQLDLEESGTYDERRKVRRQAVRIKKAVVSVVRIL